MLYSVGVKYCGRTLKQCPLPKEQTVFLRSSIMHRPSHCMCAFNKTRKIQHKSLKSHDNTYIYIYSANISSSYHLIITYPEKIHPLLLQHEHGRDKNSLYWKGTFWRNNEWNNLDSNVAQAGSFDIFKSCRAPPAP